MIASMKTLTTTLSLTLGLTSAKEDATRCSVAPAPVDTINVMGVPFECRGIPKDYKVKNLVEELAPKDFPEEMKYCCKQLLNEISILTTSLDSAIPISETLRLILSDISFVGSLRDLLKYPITNSGEFIRIFMEIFTKMIDVNGNIKPEFMNTTNLYLFVYSELIDNPTAQEYLMNIGLAMMNFGTLAEKISNSKELLDKCNVDAVKDLLIIFAERINSIVLETLPSENYKAVKPMFDGITSFISAMTQNKKTVSSEASLTYESALRKFKESECFYRQIGKKVESMSDLSITENFDEIFYGIVSCLRDGLVGSNN